MAVLGFARVGKARLGAFRLGRGQPWIRVIINGVTHDTDVRIVGAEITDELNHEPNTVQLRCDGFTPIQGQDVKIYCADTNAEHQIFGGVILSVAQSYEEKPANIAWDVNCIDYTWLLNRRKVIKKYTSQSATAIVQDLISSFTSGFTSLNVTSGLATIDEITFTNDDVTDAITRVMERIGGYWYSDYSRDVHAFLVDTEAAAAITQAIPRGMRNIVQRTDLSQVATRVTARGGGASALSDVAIGGTTIPIEDSSWYSVSGGTVEVGPQRPAYTSVQNGNTGCKVAAFVADPTSALIAAQIGGPSFPNNWQGYWAFVFVDAAGNTTGAGLSVSGLYTNNSGGTVDYSLSSIDTGPTGTVKRKIYRTKNGGNGGFFLLTTINDNSTTTYTDSTTDALLGTETLPTTNSTSAPIGSTSLRVEDLAQFLSGGGWAEAPGGQVFSYTGRSASSGTGTLTGIPSSGTGSLGATVGAGTVNALPHLAGVTGIVYAINKGDPVNIIVTVNDATAQTALAALVGGDGVHEMFITDGRWAITEATAQATTEVTMRKNPIVTVEFDSRDSSIVSGRDITITLSSPAISGTFKIQRVTFSEIGVGGALAVNNIWPLRHVECSSRRFSFEDLLRQIKGRAA
jgi:hypothetical protein